jgi:DNA repair exonuclease SbcCD ATPase subunit
VIKLESVHIEEVRGIRRLDLEFYGEQFAISGPNGSGKSGVIDAIEFGLTGNIGRLTGRGTKGLSVSEHGPHVEKTKFPDAAFVTLKVILPSLGKTATITRKVNAPKKPKIEPADPAIVAVLEQVADHPEITLSRREILRFILVEPTKRSEEIQTILKLDQIGQTRSALNAAKNKLSAAQKTAAAQVQAARDALLTHLGIPALKLGDLLAEVNKRRAALAASTIAELTADTRLDAGLSETATPAEFNKQSALRDVKALADAAGGLSALAERDASTIVAGVKELEADPALFTALQRRSLVEKGLELVDGPECPLCDRAWEDANALRAHLKGKLTKSEQARMMQKSLVSSGSAIAQEAVKLAGLLPAVRKLAQNEEQDAFALLLGTWKADLEGFRARIGSVDGIIGEMARLAAGWPSAPGGLLSGLTALREKLAARPDQASTLDAQTFLTTAQLRLSDYREAMRSSAAADRVQNAAEVAHDTYCTVMEEELNALYEQVQKDFSAFYRAINAKDESTFTAKLTPTEGGLDLDVNFYERGLFPPAAYHSEGHQDGMGVCLYLALMKRSSAPSSRSLCSTTSSCPSIPDTATNSASC